MSTFEDMADDVGLCAKAALHIGLSREYLQRYLIVSEDPVLAGALFCAGVVKYAVPFTPSITTRNKRLRLDVTRLIQSVGFDQGMHEHLLELRNRLVAHDDLGLMKHRTVFIQSRHTIDGTEYEATRSLGVANKALHRPTTLTSAEQILAHIVACEIRAQDLVYETLDVLQQRAATHPQEMVQWRSFNDTLPGKDDDGKPLPVPELHGNARFVAPEPAFSAAKDGYFYSALNLAANYEPPFPILVKGQMIGLVPGESSVASSASPSADQ